MNWQAHYDRLEARQSLVHSCQVEKRRAHFYLAAGRRSASDLVKSPNQRAERLQFFYSASHTAAHAESFQVGLGTDRRFRLVPF